MPHGYGPTLTEQIQAIQEKADQDKWTEHVDKIYHRFVG